jgi:signal transduction histidine kinase
MWRLLLRWRWLLGGAITIAFALGRLLEALVLGNVSSQPLLLLDVLGWGVLGGLAVWLSLTWVSVQERRHQTRLEQALEAQQSLNRQLQRSNEQLALLSEVNRNLADSATLDEILDATLAFPQRLVPARAAALWLNDQDHPILTRTEGATAEEFARLRARFNLTEGPVRGWHPSLLTSSAERDGADQCLVVPLSSGATLIGWLELFLERPAPMPDDELGLLETIACEIAEAVIGARRRSREERAIFELERAISEERARIARDIHDGLAQTLAFRRMRVDLWLDWLDSDRPRLREELVELKSILREQIAELRRAIFALRPVQFDELGFVGGLHRYVTDFASQQGWAAQVNLAGVPPALSPAVEAACFRIVQEALTNAAKHAGATHVEVRLEQADQGLCISVGDNGRGFEPGSVQEGVMERLGLRQMRERVVASHGQLTVLSQPGAGTVVRAWIPLPSPQQGVTHV